MVELLDLQV